MTSDFCFGNCFNMQKLTERQKKFVLCYDGNATEAAKKAGYSEKTAYSIGYENLRKPEIALALKERADKEAPALIKNRKQRQLLWSRLADSEDPYVAMKASELLAKSEGDFIDKVYHSGDVVVSMPTIKLGGKPLEFDVGSS